MPKRRIIRHAETPLSDRLYDNPELTDRGVEQAKALRRKFEQERTPLGIVVVSRTIRTRETALLAGAVEIIEDTRVGETVTNIPRTDLTAMLKEGKVPKEALLANEALLSRPPEFTDIVTHAHNMAALAILLGIEDQFNGNLLPNPTEVWEMDF